MAELTWDQVGERYYQEGVDRGVLYLDTGSGVAWNGLVAVGVEENATPRPLVFDGFNYMHTIDKKSLAVELSAYTYPDELELYLGNLTNEYILGLYFKDQTNRSFSITYRTFIGDDVNGSTLGYKIHILYNLTAKFDPPKYGTNHSDISEILFDMALVGQPEVIPGYVPTAYAIIDSRSADPAKLAYLESIIYGDEAHDAYLPPMSDLLSAFSEFFTVMITDNGDGTWTATGPDDLVMMTDETTFSIDGATVVILDADTYTIESG